MDKMWPRIAVQISGKRERCGAMNGLYCKQKSQNGNLRLKMTGACAGATMENRNVPEASSEARAQSVKGRSKQRDLGFSQKGSLGSLEGILLMF